MRMNWGVPLCRCRKADSCWKLSFFPVLGKISEGSTSRSTNEIQLSNQTNPINDPNPTIQSR